MLCSSEKTRAALACLGLFVGCTDVDDFLTPSTESSAWLSSSGSLSGLTALSASPSEVEGRTLSLEQADALRSCKTACKVQASCSLDLEILCNANCERAVPVLAAHDCLEQAASENDCLASMECRELRQYSNNGRRMNEKCGDRARAFFDECTVGRGVVPASCSEMCQHFLDCEELDIAVEACEETCVANATGLSWTHGEACSGAFLDFAGCVAKASCEEIDTLIDRRVAPSSCLKSNDVFRESCN